MDSFVYQTFWDMVDDSFACFQGLNNGLWDSLYNLNMPEIAGGVSKGRLSALLTHSSLSLQESHTWIEDVDVVFTEPDPGVPLLYVWTVGYHDHFGAALTTSPDSTIFVYRVVENHPLGLVPGDEILGYDGIPWCDLYQQLIDIPLPIQGLWGSSPSSYTHAWMNSAGWNWHLFDTIDIAKYETGDTMHLSTEALIGQSETIFGTEQMYIPGVPFPDWASNQWVSHGFIDGTTIGYIYVLSWYYPEIMGQFNDAVSVMMTDATITGLIIDYRANSGGWANARDGYALLFDSTIDVYSWGERCNADDRLLMCPDYDGEPPDSLFDIYGNPSTYFNKPIAMLTGPGCVSAGDYNALALAFHPMVKVFGRPTMAALNAPPNYYIYITPDNKIKSRYAHGDAYLNIDPHNYLTHKEFPGPEDFPWVDYQEVWLTQEGVANGRDDVVDSAVAWILSSDMDQDGVVNENDNCPLIYNPDQEDMDADVVGDSCDNCIDVYNPSQADVDEDGVGDACDWTCGDANSDGFVNILDITYLIAFLYKGGSPPDPMESADVNNTGNLNILDITYLIAYLYKSGPEPDCP